MPRLDSLISAGAQLEPLDSDDDFCSTDLTWMDEVFPYHIQYFFSEACLFFVEMNKMILDASLNKKGKRLHGRDFPTGSMIL